MLYRLASDAHAVRSLVQAGLHGFKDFLVLPARHAALLARSTFLLDGTLLAVRAPIAVLHQAVLETCVPPNQVLSGRAAVFVLLRVIDEIGPVELSIRLGTRGGRLWNDRGDSRFIAGQDLFALEVTAIRNRSDFISTHRGAGLLGHGG